MYHIFQLGLDLGEILKNYLITLCGKTRKRRPRRDLKVPIKRPSPRLPKNTPSFPFLVDPQVTSNLGAMDGNNQQSNKESFKTKS
jgi:hypothetical protein